MIKVTDPFIIEFKRILHVITRVSIELSNDDFDKWSANRGSKLSMETKGAL